jgi:hypothetical protein
MKVYNVLYTYKYINCIENLYMQSYVQCLWTQVDIRTLESSYQTTQSQVTGEDQFMVNVFL